MASVQLQQLTGLQAIHAQHLLSQYDGNVDVALASFVQSLPRIPRTYFDDAAAYKKNALAINDRLLRTYAAVRAALKGPSPTDESEAWRAVQVAPLVLPSAAAKSLPTAPAAASAPPVAPPAATASPAVASASPRSDEVAPVDAQQAGSTSPPADHFPGCFLDMPNFWVEEVEKRAALLTLNNGFLQANPKDVLRARLLRWHGVAGPFYQGTPLRYIPMPDLDETTLRVIIKDAERTFFHKEHQVKFTTFLWAVYHEFGAYGQSMSYLAGLCLLALTEQETVAVLRKVNKEYITGHWATEAVGFATNAYVVEDYIAKRFPDVIQSFKKLSFMPETYMQKIMSGLCVHVLPFDLLFQFLDHFIAEGFPFLVKFELAIVEHFRAKLLAIKEAIHINELFSIMRLDPSACEGDDQEAVLRRAPAIDLGAGFQNHILTMRSQMYDKIIGPRLAKVPKTKAFEPCVLCDVREPTLFCDDCGAICKECHEAEAKDHIAAHEVDKY